MAAAPMITSVPRSLSFDLGALLGRGIVWTPWRKGIDICRIYGDGRVGPAAAFLRYAPHAEVPLHEHDGHEHIFVLSGMQEDESGTYPAGTMIVNPPGSRHRVRSPEGCTVLVLWEQPIVFLESA
ncbi:MAG: cupin domain-containing protein [Myxococcota bacterium]|nr:cupin domain-containing protein [Myxococcota bacterium]